MGVGQSSQSQLIAEHSRPSPHLTRCLPSGHHGIMSLQQHRQPSVVVGRDGQVHSHQVTGTLSVPPGLLLDNYGAISGDDEHCGCIKEMRVVINRKGE